MKYVMSGCAVVVALVCVVALVHFAGFNLWPGNNANPFDDERCYPSLENNYWCDKEQR